MAATTSGRRLSRVQKGALWFGLLNAVIGVAGFVSHETTGGCLLMIRSPKKGMRGPVLRRRRTGPLVGPPPARLPALDRLGACLAYAEWSDEPKRPAPAKGELHVEGLVPTTGGRSLVSA